MSPVNNYKISAIYIYPIKSLGGIPLQSSFVGERGLKYDRRWMLVDEENKFITQRTQPHMALLQVEINETHLVIKHKLNKIPPLHILLSSNLNDEINVQVWKDNVTALAYDEDINDWFSEAIGVKCKLVYMPLSTKRRVDPKYAADKTVGFADGYPFMIIGEESLNDLNSKLKQPLPVIRFRPNFVFSGGNPFDEDNWKHFEIGEIKFRAVKPCARCVIPTVDPETGVKGKEPLKTLATFRKRGEKVMFGMNLVAENTGTINLGDKIFVLQKNIQSTP